MFNRVAHASAEFSMLPKDECGYHLYVNNFVEEGLIEKLQLSTRMVYAVLKAFVLQHYFTFYPSFVPKTMREVVRTGKIMYLFLASVDFQLRFIEDEESY